MAWPGKAGPAFGKEISKRNLEKRFKIIMKKENEKTKNRRGFEGNPKASRRFWSF